MGASRSLRNKIVPLSLELAQKSAARRWLVYLHSKARERAKLSLQNHPPLQRS